MQELLEQIQVEGVHDGIFDVATRRGADTPGHPSRWKTYYRSSTFPDLGVLLAHEDAETSIETLRARLDEEADNYRRLLDVGFDVPATAGRSVEVVDHLAGGRRAAALIVEHVAGSGPYKARTDVRRIARVVMEQEASLTKRFTEAWAGLRVAAARKAPQDLQVMLGDDGRIVTIDPEKVGPGVALNDLT
ncbi:hypothetical protein ACH0BU_12780 [Sphingomonas olei]